MIGNPKNATISKDGDFWFVSIQTEREIDEPIHQSNQIVGLDLGIIRFLTNDDGTFIEPQDSFKKYEIDLIIAQKRLSNKKKFSKNWKKAKKKVNKIHKKIKNLRHDFLHKLSTKITNENQVVVIEDLDVKSMTKKKNQWKSSLNKSILDQGWYSFRQFLTYKSFWKGGMVVPVSPAYTSQTCSKCGKVDKLSRRSQSEFCCIKCGFELNADHNAAINIRRAGQAQIVCGDPNISVNEAETRIICEDDFPMEMGILAL